MTNTLPRISPRLLTIKQIGTFTLSAALLHFSAFAECGPYGEGQCGECGPHWSDWYPEEYPTISNTASVTPSAYGCVQTAQSPPQPTVVRPTFTVGRKAKVGSYDCSSDLTYEYQNVTFTVGAVQWDPPLPATFNASHAPSFTSSAYVTITSSDPLHCPPPVDAQGRYTIGSCTWNVVDASIHLTTVTSPIVPEWVAELVNLASEFTSLWPINVNQVTKYEQSFIRGLCCNNTPSSVDWVKSGVNAGTTSFSVDIGAASLKSLALEVVDMALNEADIYSPILSDAVKAYIENEVNVFEDQPNPNVSAASITASATANYYDVIGYTDTCLCPGEGGGWYGTKRAGYSCAIGTVSVPASVFQAHGHNVTLNIQCLVGNLEHKVHGYDSYTGPYTTAIPHKVETTSIKDIKTTYQIGASGIRVYKWSESPAPNTTTNESVICHGNNYPS